MITSLEHLRNAAKGQITKKDPTQSTLTPANAPSYQQSLQNRGQYGYSANDAINSAAKYDALMRSAGFESNTMADVSLPGAKENKTNLYNSLLASGRATGGLSSKGKYSGFNTSADLQTAIEGNAINLRQSGVSQLRANANKLLTDLDKAYTPAMVNTVGTAGFEPQTGGAANFRIADQLKSGDWAPRVAYARKLSNWAGEQSKPAEEYLKTAQQIESTPMSQLAQSIATSAYGMNPDLAAGKFQGLDASVWKNSRDQQYINRYGMPYDQYQSVSKEYEDLTANKAKTDLENATGFASKSLAGVTGMTTGQLSNALTAPIEYVEPMSNSKLSGSGKDALDFMKKFIAEGSPDNAKKIMDDISATPGYEGVAALLKAYYHMSVIQPNKYNYQNAMYGINP